MSSEMLREVSESLFEFLIEAFPMDKSYSRADIEQDPMPPLLAHFLGQTLQHKLDMEVEHLRTVRSTWFDYNHADVQHTYKAFIAALAQNSRIPSEEWRATLKRATKLIIAHLILPTHTLVEFVFRDDEGPLPAPVIYRQLSYFAVYPYLREAVETFLKKRQLKEIDRTRFSSLLSQIDRHMTANHTADDWLKMLRPLFDLMRRIPQTRNQGVPIDLLSMFFGDKEAYEVQERLQVEKEVHRVSTINEESLRLVVEGSVGPFEQQLEPTPVHPVPTTPPISAAPTTLPDSPQHLEQPPSYAQKAADSPTPAPVEKPSESEKETSDESSTDAKPLWAQYQSQSEPETPAATSNGHQPPVETKGDGSVPLWMQFQQDNETENATTASEAISQGEADKTSPPPSPPSSPFNRQPKTATVNTLSLDQIEEEVLGIYGSTNRGLFIENLFAGSNEAYEQFLHQVKQIPDWSSVSQVIAEEVFKKHKVNIYSPVAIMFTESIEEQFRIGS